jgi:hypothetical protein
MTTNVRRALWRQFSCEEGRATLPLWILFLAGQLPDVLWAVFVLLGIEHYRIVPGITASLPRKATAIPNPAAKINSPQISRLAPS